jgi:pimeloyl-ACP methyl ester carboxylesterase
MADVTFVLIPGAGGAAWSWHRLVDELARRGHPAVAVDLPGEDPTAGIEEYVGRTAAVAAELGEVVLVAHSMGGLTAPLVCHRLPVRMLVLLNAMIPAPGETGGQWWDNTGHALGEEFDVLAHFYNDFPADLREQALANDRDQSDRAFATPWPLEAWPDVPTKVLATEDDRLFTPDFQTRVARERLGLVPDFLPGGHFAALSRPVEVADRLVAYLRELP